MSEMSVRSRASTALSEKVENARAQGETLLNTTMEISVPEILEINMQQVRLGSVLGKGGAGSVYAGELLDTELISRNNGRKVAVKLLQFPEKMPKEQQTARLLQEVSIMWSCSFHPTVVDFVGFSKEPMVIITTSLNLRTPFPFPCLSNWLGITFFLHSFFLSFLLMVAISLLLFLQAHH